MSPTEVASFLENQITSIREFSSSYHERMECFPTRTIHLAGHTLTWGFPYGRRFFVMIAFGEPERNTNLGLWGFRGVDGIPVTCFGCSQDNFFVDVVQNLRHFE